jgi:hypothetical protein
MRIQNPQRPRDDVLKQAVGPSGWPSDHADRGYLLSKLHNNPANCKGYELPGNKNDLPEQVILIIQKTEH